MFLDEVNITVIAGNGGNGCVSFRREKYVPRGGPDGGDGGDGGSVYCLADPAVNTLYHLAGKHHWRATGGAGGMGKKCYGRKGVDVVVRVPPGTIIRDAERGVLLKDLAESGQKVCVAIGGHGGKGNAHFATSTNQAPR
ncbi:MAG: GTPase ObgE, partial [Phycisphaerae bacterium]|nr:GTPase ObgE [Phycisphaerae bacterium]